MEHTSTNIGLRYLHGTHGQTTWSDLSTRPVYFSQMDHTLGLSLLHLSLLFLFFQMYRALRSNELDKCCRTFTFPGVPFSA